MLHVPSQQTSPDKLFPPRPVAPKKYPDLQQKPSSWKRLIAATLFLGLGVAAAVVGTGAITYRFTHLTIQSGLINGRTVQLRVPVNGTIKAFYAQPGAPVKTGQVLARIEPGTQESQTLLQTQGEVDSTASQLSGATDSLAFLQQQLAELQGKDEALHGAKVAIAQGSLSHEQAALDAAAAKATAARLDYKRYRELHADGAISQQKVDQTQLLWESAEAEVKQAKASLASSQVSLGAYQKRVPISQGSTLAEQQLNLQQTLQTQTTLVNTLKAQLAAKKQQLQQVQALYSSRRDVEVQAPFTGVVYRTEREQGEQVNRPDALLTLLDCNNLWIETLVPADQASRIDVQQPVRVQMMGDAQTFVGQVDLIQAVTGVEALKQQVQAIVPAAASSWAGQPLARVTIKIPPPAQQTQAQQFCGIGQSAQLTFGVKLFASH